MPGKPKAISKAKTQSKGSSGKREEKAKSKEKDQVQMTAEQLEAQRKFMSTKDFCLMNNLLMHNSMITNTHQKHFNIFSMPKLESPDSVFAKEKQNSNDRHIVSLPLRTASKTNILQNLGHSYSEAIAVGWELKGDRARGDKYAERKQTATNKKILRLNIPTLKRIKIKTLLEEIIGKEDNDFSKRGKPIIVVPMISQENNLCLSNSKDFFEKGEFIPPSKTEAKLTDKQKFEERTEFVKDIDGKKVGFEVYNSVTSFDDYQWSRVVAVFLHDQDWQFKDWKGGNKLGILFKTLKPFYFHSTFAEIPKIVKKFAIPHYVVDPSDETKNKVAHKEVWESIINLISRPRFNLK